MRLKPGSEKPRELGSFSNWTLNCGTRYPP
jgi:hypothetical protein